MKILTKTEGEKWLLEKKIPIDLEKLRFLHKTYIAYQLPEPPITQVQITLAKNLIHLMQEVDGKMNGEGVFWITHRDGLHDRIDLFDGYRKSLNENRALEEAPFHVFDKSDLSALECLLELTLYFGFFAYLISPDRETVVYINEEWFIDVSCKNENNYKLYRELFEGMKFKEIKKK